MKKIFFLLAAIAFLASCNEVPRTTIQRSIDQYALVELSTDLVEVDAISPYGREVLNLYRFAAQEVDNIYWQQNFGSRESLLGVSPQEMRFADINFGPWDRLNGTPFIAGYDYQPKGANFYPSDMTSEEFEAFDDPDKNSPYTVIRRDENGNLKTVWYHDAFADNISKICAYLTAASDITIKPSVREYLIKKIDAIRSDSYYDAEKAWLDMKDSKMDLIIGPDESTDDNLFGIKRSYEAFVLVKDLSGTAMVHKYVPMLPELQKSLPGEEQYKSFVPGDKSDILVCDAICYGGQANAGIKAIAINLPFDEKAQADFGTRTIIFKNVAGDKFARTVKPIGEVLLDKDQQVFLDQSAFGWTVTLREVAHGLGVKETINGKGTVADALGNQASIWEEAKANMAGVYLATELAKKYELEGIVSKKEILTTAFANLIRSTRFGNKEPLGRSNIMTYNYLLELGAFARGDNGRYVINYDKMEKAVAEYLALILKVQATGDREFATKFEAEHSSEAELVPDVRAIRLENIPIDVRFSNPILRK